jgi:hypothetical protein
MMDNLPIILPLVGMIAGGYLMLSAASDERKRPAEDVEALREEILAGFERLSREIAETRVER